MKKILVIAAHPDDEVLGCGGTIARLTSEGCEVQVLIAAEGLTSRLESGESNDVNQQLLLLKEKCIQANRVLGVSHVEFLGFPDNKMDTVSRLDIIKKIEKKLKEFQADTIFTHFPYDLNVDHRLLSESVITATRTQPGQSVKKVYYFEVLSSTDWVYSSTNISAFNPNVYINTANFLEKKMKAISVYESEMRSFPHSRSVKNVENLSYHRGATAGFNSAEAFMLARELV